jgi:hypothetical protein
MRLHLLGPHFKGSWTLAEQSIEIAPSRGISCPQHHFAMWLAVLFGTSHC